MDQLNLTDTKRFGLGHVFLSTEQEMAILTEMEWDGVAMPYPLLREWFERSVENALFDVVQRSKPTAKVVRALTSRDYAKESMPEKKGSKRAEPVAIR
jgi:hypothetical protein